MRTGITLSVLDENVCPIINSYIGNPCVCREEDHDMISSNFLLNLMDFCRSIHIQPGQKIGPEYIL